MSVTFVAYLAELSSEPAEIVGQVPSAAIKLSPPSFPEARLGEFHYFDPAITHMTEYKGMQLSYVDSTLPLPEYWVIKEDNAYILYSYVAEPFPEIDLVRILMMSPAEVQAFLKQEEQGN